MVTCVAFALSILSSVMTVNVSVLSTELPSKISLATPMSEPSTAMQGSKLKSPCYSISSITLHQTNIFIGLPDTGYQFIYLDFQIWSMNASANKESWIKIFPQNLQPLRKKIQMALASLLQFKCFRTAKTSKRFTRSPEKILRASC